MAIYDYADETDEEDELTPPVGALAVSRPSASRPDVGGLASVYDTAIQRLKASRSGEPSRAEKLFAISAALGSPTRTGTLGETFGNLSKVLGETTAGAREARTAREDKIAALEFAKAKELAQNEARFAELQMRYGTPKPVRLVANPVTGAMQDPYTGKVVIPGAGGYRQVTQDGIRGQIDPKGKFEPLPQYAQPSAKALPARIQQMEEADISDISIASALRSDIAAARAQLESGTLDLNPVGNLIGSAKNAVGMSDEKSRNLASFRALIEKMRNDALLLQKGPQTEGDAVRALNQIMVSISDPKVVSQRLAEMDENLKRKTAMTTARVKQRRTERGVPISDLSDYIDVGAAYGTQDPNLTAARAEADKRKGTSVTVPPVGTVKGGYRFKGGNPASPNSWEKI